MLTYLSGSEDDTFRFGDRIGENVKPGDILLLYGDLGSGKTVLARGIAHGVGVSGMVTSPTFTLMNPYVGKYPVYHFDLYRLTQPEELYDLDYEEYFYGDGIAVVEWPERMDDLIPEEHLKIFLEKTDSEDRRKIMLESLGGRYQVLEEVLQSYEGIGS